MKTENTLSPTESLGIIGDMVDQARFNFSKNSFYLLMWGCLLIGAATFQLLGKTIFDTNLIWIGWPIAGTIGGIISGIQGKRIANQLGHQTHIDNMYGAVWVIYFITLILLIPALVTNGMNPSGYVMILTGLPTVFTGKLIRFNPLVVGGASFWILGICAIFFLPEYGEMLFILSMVTGYLIPGFMMRAIKQ
jgi:hypothetical protein